MNESHEPIVRVYFHT